MAYWGFELLNSEQRQLVILLYSLQYTVAQFPELSFPASDSSRRQSQVWSLAGTAHLLDAPHLLDKRRSPELTYRNPMQSERGIARCFLV